MTIVRASVFLASLAAAAPAAADVPGGTGTTERLALGANAGGELGPGPDSDWFRLTLEAGRLHAFTVSTFAAGGNIGFRLAARDAAGRVLAADDLPTRGDSEVLQINFRPRVAGTYFLEVTFPSFWTPGPASTLPYEVGLRRDASSSFGDAARLPFGRLVPGTMESTTDRDYHVVRLAQGEPVDVLSPGIATWDTVALFDRDRRLLGTVNDRFGKLAHHVPAYTGDHYILVSLPFASRYTLKVAPADRGRPTPGGDLLVGTDKPAALDANGGDDEVRGLAGADVLRGGAGDDTILGGAGDDTLRGSRGADQLSGDAGEDALTGGRDPDDLRGGPGRDTFLFYGDAARGHDSGSRSNPDPYQRGLDRIHDFAPGDRIDLRGVDADAARPGRQPFSFVGAAPFSGSAQVRHGFEPDTDSADRTMTVVAVSTDADPAPEMEILLRGHHALRAADFVLRDLPRRR